MYISTYYSGTIYYTVVVDSRSRSRSRSTHQYQQYQEYLVQQQQCIVVVVVVVIVGSSSSTQYYGTNIIHSSNRQWKQQQLLVRIVLLRIIKEHAFLLLEYHHIDIYVHTYSAYLYNMYVSHDLTVYTLLLQLCIILLMILLSQYQCQYCIILQLLKCSMILNYQ